MSTIRKCPKCNHWNAEEDYCQSCGYLLNHQIRLELEDKARDEEAKNRIPEGIEKFLLQMKTSKWMLIRGLYYVLYSVWFLIFSIVSFFIALIALGPG